jgi:hypothetical protein
VSLFADEADDDDESLALKILLKRSHLKERRSFLLLPFSALFAFFPILPMSLALLTFSLFSTLALDLKDLLLT